MTSALKIQNLSKSFKKNGVLQPVVSDLNLDIAPGEIVGLLGPNGAGKSTIINMISGVTRLGGGKIEVYGHDNVTDYLITRRAVGVMHQEIVVDNFFPIGIALKMHAGYYGVADDPKWRGLLIDRLDLGPHLEKKMLALSGGMRRRFMVAKALIHRPKLLILDEPTAGVDVELRRTLWEFVREVNQQGTTVLLTTHYLEEAEKMCGRIAIMDHGRLVTLERTEHLIRQLNEKKLLLTLESAIAARPEWCAYPVAVEADGKRWNVTLPKDVLIGDFLKLCQKHGVGVSDIRTEEVSLEDVFLKLTGTRARAEAARP
ncbi:MAG: ABC transporter ATP-binding protein [Bacteriovoracia bacterium]